MQKFNALIEGILAENDTSESTEYIPVKLGYPNNALEPYIDAETMHFHYEKHYKGYVKKLNELLKGKPKPELAKLVNNLDGYDEKVKFNAGGAYNHQIFWEMMIPKPKPISGAIKKAINKSFGTFKKFQDEFVEQGTGVMGSGWVWLIQRGEDDPVEIIITPNQVCPISDEATPILGADLFEHSYYLKYKNDREKYLNNFFNVVNWDYCNYALNGFQKLS